VLDPALRVMARFPFYAQDSNAAAVFSFLEKLPPVDQSIGFPIQAPVLFIPNVFEPEFCNYLIQQYESHGGTESGYMTERDGKTVGVSNRSFKSRKDFTITERPLIEATQARMVRRVIPEIAKVHFFKASRMERYIVSCYAVEEGGHFKQHRDNTTRGTAHRRFAVSINLNADFDGGEVSFPEYGPRSFKAPPGGAVVFSCSLLHAVSKVTRGRRYAFLPFLYDDEAAKIRQANNEFLDDGIGKYHGGGKPPATAAATA
jgi:predicted 2-oxoglutarate/Fe(II)-dependent dioxygenase YbiX